MKWSGDGIVTPHNESKKLARERKVDESEIMGKAREEGLNMQKDMYNNLKQI